MKKVFITGITGFAGSFLAEYLLSLGNFAIKGTYLTDESLSLIAGIKEKIEPIKLNLLDDKKVNLLIDEYKPDIVFHLAALTSPADSFANPAATITNNVTAQINLLEAIRKSKLLDTKILIISSADVYGIVDKKDLPIDEETSFRPTNTYSVSKIAQDFLGFQYFLSYGLKIIRVRPFNHIGPRQSPKFVVASFAKQIAEIENGKTEPTIFVGNLSAKRDFTDVRDMVKAYLLALEKGAVGDVYNIGSGSSYRISEILDKLLLLSKKNIEIKVDKSRFRPSDEQELICDRKKFTDKTGWEPKIALETTLKDTLDYWRKII
ncbi:MAG: GDP-mannose 4,6-dehydratase [Candidatus Levybacteria bacterium]|nr:GDP-mannose 4,6-dehydratase [Candidatus Levybacteria bacterium]